MRKYIYGLLLGILIAAQIIFTAYVFSHWKTGLHCDEVWSYGFANSYYHPFLSFQNGAHLLSFVDEDVINWEEWFPGEEMWKYLTVQEGERFAYGSVYYNNIYDMHPPLYYMLLHTLCSFFPERFSLWYGESLNFLFLALTQIFLFLTVRKVTGKEITALATCLFYGGSRGALLTFTFIRQYSLALVFCMMFVYFSACFYDELSAKEHFSGKHVVLAAAAAGLSFLTHYYGILFAGIFTASLCLCLLIKRKFKAMLSYGFSMLIALGAAIGVYPAMIEHFMSDWSPKMTSYSSPTQFRMLLNYLFRYDYGFGINYFPNAFWDITLPLVAAGIVVIMVVLFLFRKEPWFPGMLQRGKDGGRLFLQWLKRANYIPLIVAMSGIGIFVFVARGVEVLTMGHYVVRYICIAIPFLAMTAVILAEVILKKLPLVRKMSTVSLLVIICAVLVKVNLTAGYPYIHPQVAGEMDIVGETAGKNVLVVDQTTNWFVTDIVWFAPYLYRAEGVYFTAADSITETNFELGIDAGKVDYVIAETEAFRLSEQEKRMLEARGGVMFEPEDANPHLFACTDRIKEVVGNRPYSIRTILFGQKGTYLILELE